MSENTYVIAGPYDNEDGTLYWSNDDGWGHLGLATVFTETEVNSGNVPLPLSDNFADPRWVLLPAPLQG